MKGIILIIILFAMIGPASAAMVEISISGPIVDGVGTFIISYTGAVDSIIYLNASDGSSIPTIPLNGSGFVQETQYISCTALYTARMYTGGSLVASDTFQRTDAGCNRPEVWFSQATYSCNSTVQVNYRYGQNSTITIKSLSDMSTILYSISSVSGSGALYPSMTFTPGFSYITEIKSAEGASITFDTTDVLLCSSGEEGGTGGGGGGGTDSDTGTGGGGGGSAGGGSAGGGSDGGTNPFTPPNSYDPSTPGQEWKVWIDLNGDMITSYAETMAAFRFWGYMTLTGSYFLAFFKFGMGFKL